MGTSARNSSPYGGPDRRQHRVYVTHNTEYHTRTGLCVAVRDRRTGGWITDHSAVGREIRGSIHRNENGGLIPYLGEPAVGDSLYFQHGHRDLITSAVESVERPALETVADYPRPSFFPLDQPAAKQRSLRGGREERLSRH